jgi:hypothetical protein
MHEVEWKRVFSGILSEKPKEREETYEWVQGKFWNEEVLEHLKSELEKPEKTLVERMHIIDAMAAVGLEKATSPLAKKRADYQQKIKQNGPDSPDNKDLIKLLSSIDTALRYIIEKIKSKSDISLKNLVQKNFALK